MKTYIMEKRAGIGPCMDVKAHNGHIYAIQRDEQYESGRLCVLTSDLTLVGQFTGIGNARQIAISGNIAIVTARENGLWIFDISKTTPELLSHYQTIEFAVGATLYANFALISCRQFGVEIVDISEPNNPKHIGIIRIGETQSACVYNGYLYGGVWGKRNVSVVDIRDINHPKLVTRIPLEGRGDGVMAWDGVLYAVTGQHRTGINNIHDATDPLYGEGNGLTMFDITDPEHPEKIHREEFGKCYNTHFDMWRPELCKSMVLCGCSSLGVFAYERRSLTPVFRLMLPASENQNESSIASETPKESSINEPPKYIQAGPVFTADAVTGFTMMGNKIYVAGGGTDLFAFDTGEELGYFFRWDIQEHIQAKRVPLEVSVSHQDTGTLVSIKQVFIPKGGLLLGVCECDEFILAACGYEGICLLDKNDYHLVKQFTVNGCCYDIKYNNGWIAVALCQKGALLCNIDHEELRIVSQIKTKKPVQQIYITPDANFLLCNSGATHCQLYNISDKNNPELVDERKATHGQLYGDNFASNTLSDGTVILYWHGDGLVYTNPSAGDYKFHRIFYHRKMGFKGFCPEDGFDTNGKEILFGLDGGYILLPRGESVDLNELSLYKSEVPIEGKFTICNNLLICAQRAEGIISVTDISKIDTPKFVGSWQTNASPGKPVFINGHIFIPASYGGLFEVCL